MSTTVTPPSGVHQEDTSTSKRKVTHNVTDGYTDKVRVSNVIVMVGLPARGKTYISKKLCRYLKWIGIRTKVFNVGEYRRADVTASDAVHGANATFFSPDNRDALKVRQESARRAMEDMADYLESGQGTVAIFDATNTTRERRSWVTDFCWERGLRCFFLESVCDDPEIIDSNVTDVKREIVKRKMRGFLEVNSPDYKGVMTAEQAKEDFMKRIDNYKAQYEPLSQVFDEQLSFIKVVNAGRSFFVNRVNGHIQSRVIYFLMNIHLLPRSIYITRHAESEYNTMDRLGGDSPLSAAGREYAQALAGFFQRENVKDLRIWCSQKIRAAQTAFQVEPYAWSVEYWKALDEMDMGICEGLTSSDILARYPKQAEDRSNDKYHYRFPSGESYEDVVARLEPVIMELERQANVLVVSHQAVLRCILAYFTERSLPDIPYMDIPLHSLIKLTPRAYHCDATVYSYDVATQEWSSSEEALPLKHSIFD